jgi:uncharacterized membrane protein
MKYLIAYVSTAVVFAALDFVWLSLASSRLYKPEIGAILSDKVQMGPAVAFYLLYVLGMVVFIVLPALRGGSVGTALAYGALFGLVAYATYDLTNMATLKVWSMKVTLADLAWGAFATAVASGAGTWITRAVVKI